MTDPAGPTAEPPEEALLAPSGRSPRGWTPWARLKPLDREILALAIPALGALIAEPLYLLVDTAVVGHLGTPELGAVSIAGNVLLVGLALCNVLAYGTTATVSRLLGAGDHREAAHQAVQSLWLAFGIGVVLGVLTFAFAPQILGLFGASDEVTELGVLYLRTSTPGIPALLLGLAGTGYLRGLQDTRTPLAVAVASALLNLVLEVVLIYGFGFGLGASALTTVIAQWAAAGFYVHRVLQAVGPHEVDLRPHAASLRSLGRLSLALVTRTLALRGSLVAATVVAARMGDEELAAYEVGFAVWSFLAMSLDAVAIAAQAMIGRYLGADDAAGARTAARRILGWGTWSGVVFLVGVLLLRPFLPELFSDDPAVVALAGFVLLWVALLQPVAGVVFALDGVLIGAGDLNFLAKAMVAAAAVFVPSVVAVGVLDLGIGWLWASIGVLMTTRLVTLLWRYRTDAWLITGATAR
jgi:putative MATE family efflux protein